MFRSIDSSSNYRIRPRRWWRAIFDTIFRVPAGGVARPVRRARVHEHKFKRDISRSAERSRVEINASVLNVSYRISRSHYTSSSTGGAARRPRASIIFGAPPAGLQRRAHRPASRATRSIPCTTFNSIFGVPARHLEGCVACFRAHVSHEYSRAPAAHLMCQSDLHASHERGHALHTFKKLVGSRAMTRPRVARQRGVKRVPGLSSPPPPHHQLIRSAQGWFYFCCAPELAPEYFGLGLKFREEFVDGSGISGGDFCPVSRAQARVRRIKKELCILARAQHHNPHPHALGHEQARLPRVDGAGAVVGPGAWYGFGKGMRRIGQLAEQYAVMTCLQTARGAVRTAQIIGVGECAVDASRSTDQNSNSTTPHAARAEAPRECAGWYACVARGGGVGVPAKPLRLVATTTQRAIWRRNPCRVRARLPRAPHARLGRLRGSGIARRGRFAHGRSRRRLRGRAPSRRVLCALTKLARPPRELPRACGAKSSAPTYSLITKALARLSTVTYLHGPLIATDY
ncbi:hypothetical protein FB451DRAFT_1437413 [Mycena latifolia]|nr:hypothetical protein FB451DRAFT_1437413 [Mycena latifolia]